MGVGENLFEITLSSKYFTFQIFTSKLDNFLLGSGVFFWKSSKTFYQCWSLYRSKKSRSNTKNDRKKYIKQKLYFRADGVRTSINSRGAPAGRPPRLRTNKNSRCAPAVFPSGSSESPYTSERRRRELIIFIIRTSVWQYIWTLF